MRSVTSLIVRRTTRTPELRMVCIAFFE